MSAAWNCTPGTRNHQLVTSNDPPSDSEVSDFLDISADIAARIKAVDEEIHALRSRLKVFEQEQSLLYDRRMKAQRVLAPIRRLPPELLAEIFSMTMPPVYIRSGYIPVGSNLSPWSLMHVCRHWRAVASSTPSLWEVIAMLYDKSENEPVYPLRLLEAHLQLARSLRIDFWAHDNEESERQKNAFILLAKHSEKWVELNIGMKAGLYPILNGLCGRLNSLRKAWLRCDDDRGLVPSPPPIVCFEGAPVLTDLGLKNMTYHSQVAAPFRQLQRYYLRTEWYGHTHVLQDLSAVAEARIIVDVDHVSTNGLARRIHFPFLRRLSVSHGAILDAIDAPELSQIALESYELERASLISSLNSLVAHSSCQLQRLAIYGIPQSETTIQLLHQFPSLEHLCLIWDEDRAGDIMQNDVDTIVSALMITATGPILTPRLRILSFAWEAVAQVDYRLLARMARARWKSESCRLERMEILRGQSEEGSEGLLDPLRMLRDAGMDLVWLEGGAAHNVMDRYHFAS
ncbi:ABC protein [Mycena indigotica]|uniref:ABC protein n=1 Tax=Mycena indigotica TaxID=2126181 RepID=A0A8H6T6Q5_9AGAR|nr:ABC protein [Mycena indigotica]KAF7312083.1 ABC protein [Mycena indigotica]